MRNIIALIFVLAFARCWLWLVDEFLLMYVYPEVKVTHGLYDEHIPDNASWTDTSTFYCTYEGDLVYTMHSPRVVALKGRAKNDSLYYFAPDGVLVATRTGRTPWVCVLGDSVDTPDVCWRSR